MIPRIKWDKHSPDNPLEEQDGIVNGVVMFFIRKVGVRKVKYILFSYPFRNKCFTSANTTRKLFTGTLSECQAMAQLKLAEHALMFIDITQVEKFQKFLKGRYDFAKSDATRAAYVIVICEFNKRFNGAVIEEIQLPQ